MRMRRVTSALGLAGTLLLPATATAQFNLSGFVGPVTISHYASCHTVVSTLCIDAAVGSGQNSSGRYFARLLSFQDIFAGFARPDIYTYVQHYITELRQEYAPSHPTDPHPEGTWLWLDTNGGWDMTTSEYGSPVNIGPLLVSWSVSLLEEPGATQQFYIDEMAFFDVSHVTTTPEPMTLTMVGAGMVGLLGYGIRRKKHSVC